MLCDFKGKNQVLTQIRFSYIHFMIITWYELKQIQANKMNPLQIFVIRAIIGLVFAVILTRMFYGRIDPIYIAGLAIILVGLAYFSEYLRKRREK
jgi:hypothetical protein